MLKLELYKPELVLVNLIGLLSYKYHCYLFLAL